jgi:DNA-binding response OmpR family regulator
MMLSMAKVLIVEDDEIVAKSMVDHITAAGHETKWTPKGEQGLAALRYESPDVVVLDLMLPQRDGWSVIESARADGIGTPIVVVSARGTEHDRVHALDIGADDYLVKPFSMAELVARVNAAARRGVRAPEAERGESIEIEELRIDPREVQAYVDGESCALTRQSSDSPSAGARPRPRGHARRLPQKLGAADAPRSHRGRLRPQAAGQDRGRGPRAHVHPDAVRRRLQARARSQELSFS